MSYIPYKQIERIADIDKTRHAMLKDGNYPPDISDCFVIGINGDCNTDCPIFKNGDCPNHDDIQKQDE